MLAAHSDRPMVPSTRLARRWLSWRGTPALSALVLGVALLAAALAPWLAPYDPNQVNLLQRFAPPAFVDGGSTLHLLGSDDLGRDVLSRLIWGTRISMLVAVVAVLADALIGTAIGLVAGYVGGLVDTVLMRLADIMLALPYLLIALVVVSIVGASLTNVIVIIVVLRWAGLARIVRGEALSLKRRDFVSLARIGGVGPVGIMIHHILPNVMNVVVVVSTLGVGAVILFESALSFLGLGVPPPTSSWGGMVAEGRSYIASAWWISLFPGLAITAVCLAANLFGDWLREALDPKQRQAR
ncbi:MAG: ABC transporter permease [Alphaproteobacteria bacterium]|nr:ABC transporter permease [Alphaproteobacteria bacterium]